MKVNLEKYNDVEFLKEVSQDKAIVETFIKGSKKKHTHEVVIPENE